MSWEESRRSDEDTRWYRDFFERVGLPDDEEIGVRDRRLRSSRRWSLRSREDLREADREVRLRRRSSSLTGSEVIVSEVAVEESFVDAADAALVADAVTPETVATVVTVALVADAVVVAIVPDGVVVALVANDEVTDAKVPGGAPAEARCDGRGMAMVKYCCIPFPPLADTAAADVVVAAGCGTGRGVDEEDLRSAPTPEVEVRSTPTPEVP